MRVFELGENDPHLLALRFEGSDSFADHGRIDACLDRGELALDPLIDVGELFGDPRALVVVAVLRFARHG